MFRHHLVSLLVCLGFALQTYGTLAGIVVVVSIGALLVGLAKALE
jgi:hypothetical protein